MIQKSFLIAVLICVGFSFITAQSASSLINSGVDLYEKGKFPESEVNFKKGLRKELETFEGHFNLGSSLYKQERYDEALQAYQSAMSLTEDENLQSKVLHNIGNTLLKSQKIKESIGAYAEALKRNPNDVETKYNLSYALNMMQNQQQQQQNQDKNQDQNKDQQQDQQQQNQEQKDQKQNKDQQQQQKPQPKDEISKEEAERILQALKKDEAELQKELRKRKAKVVKKEKDW
jgi:Ca-activated chloride channel family protein